MFAGKKIHVVGLGKTGLSAARFLQHHGAQVSVWDDKENLRDEAYKNNFIVHDVLNGPAAFDFFLWSPGIPHTYPKPHPLAVYAKAHNIPLICDVDILAQIQKNADFIGITGTNGKSTTTALMAHCLQQFRRCEMGGNIGVPALDLPLLSRGETYVLELSSYQLELTPHISLSASVLLNITPDHLPRHGGMDGYIVAKEKIFDKNKNGLSVVGIDTSSTAQIYERLKKSNRHVIPFSTQHEVAQGVFVKDGVLYDSSEGIVQHVGDLREILTLSGQHNHENVAAVYATLRRLYAYESDAIFNAMKSFAGLPHRQYQVRKINRVTYINDSKATNTDATAKALATFDNIFWICGGQMKDGGLNGLESFMPKIHRAYTIGEAQENFTQWLSEKNVNVTACGTLDKALKKAHQDAQGFSQDAVVLLSPACASWDQFLSFEDRGDQFAHMVKEL